MAKFADVRDDIVAEILNGADEGHTMGAWDYLAADNDADLAVEFYYTDSEHKQVDHDLTAKQVTVVTALVDEGLNAARKRYIAGNIADAGDLDDLRNFLNRVDAYAKASGVDVQSLYDATSLPTFDGDEPADTAGIYSWSADQILINENGWTLAAR